MIRKLVVASVLALASAPLLAAECSVDVEGTDQMTFNTKEIKVSKSCKTFTVNLKHVGKLPKNVMGHNWVLSKTADAQAIATEGMTAGVDKDYLKADDARIIAHTKLIGGGETATTTIDVSKLAAGESYEFFCSFPGHVSMMKGTLALVD
ncbi:azurin [Pseudomonas sp. No.21]|jgi:azurin|uniref:Azurin n=1 Tax=Pseudomonas tohonis TaxID=2725477 RepID=A0A6J4ECW9_9PSED|nr:MULTISPECIES: azurin [Pseudomonas]MDW3716480.1 azurin [Pseudomonas sp. 2023EL-01195]PZE10443.1 azurin [Pseudomonas sp. 57B-090624]UXY52459.1 azurin [Pseudomonas tohonis]BBP85738.1 azurin [Pseudomonas sp. Pc102]BCG27278.1 azurin [Pseudomonas tohonis]